MKSRAFALALCLFAAADFRAHAAGTDVVIYASDVTNVQGNWWKASDGSAAGGQLMSSGDNGWSATSAPLASPNDYFEAAFTASAGTAYHVWLRLRASGNSKWNDSVWVQFSDSVSQGGSAIYRIGTTGGIAVNLATDSTGSSLGGWGWQDGAYWLSQTNPLQFASSGSHTIRVQTREDGVQIDQIVISPATYLSNAPGGWSNDATIVSKSSGSGGGGGGSSTPYTGSPASIPGTIQAENFDNGGEGVAYHDNSSGNAGGAYRSTDVDLASGGTGTVVGWVGAGEWLKYTVNVASSGTYTVNFSVASAGQGGSFHLEMNGTNVTGSLTVPNTGGWNNFQTVSATVQLSAGQQIARLYMDSAGSNSAVGNFDYFTFTATSSSTTTSESPYGGSPAAIPGTIQIENFDNGGEGVGYHDNSSGNAGGAYRNTDVDITSGGTGTIVGWVGAGEWLKYTVNVASSGTYTMNVSVASAGQGGSFHLEMNGTNVSGSLFVPNTGGWTNFQTVSATVQLSAGQQIARLYMDTAGSNSAVGNFDYMQFTAGASAPAPPPPPPPPPSGSGTLRMMTWNIRSGTDGSGNYTLPQQVSFMASQNPDVIVLQEVSTWNEYQPDKFLSLIQQTTGQTWYRVWAPALTCQTTGCIGPMILSRYPIWNQTTTYLGPSSAGMAQITVGGVPITIVTNHLEYYDTGLRTSELNQLMSWEQNFGGPRLDGGDFNSWWGEWWIGQMETQYTDTWLDVTGQEDGAYTTGNVRFDYIFRAFDSAWRLTPTNAFVPGTSLSDHRPFVADFKVQ